MKSDLQSWSGERHDEEA